MRKTSMVLLTVLLFSAIGWNAEESFARPSALFIGVRDLGNSQNPIDMGGRVRKIESREETRRIFHEAVFLDNVSGHVNVPTMGVVSAELDRIARSRPEAIFVYYGGHATMHGLSFHDTLVRNSASYVSESIFLDEWILRGGPGETPVARNIFVVIEACNPDLPFLADHEPAPAPELSPPPGIDSLVIMRTGIGLIRPRFMDFLADDQVKILENNDSYRGREIFETYQRWAARQGIDVPDSCLITHQGDYTFLDKTPSLHISLSPDFPPGVELTYQIIGTDITGRFRNEASIDFPRGLLDPSRKLTLVLDPEPDSPDIQYRQCRKDFHVISGRFYMEIDRNCIEESEPILRFSFNNDFPHDVTARYSIQRTTIRGIAAADEEIELPDSLVGSPVDVEIAYYSERNVQYENNVMSVQVSQGTNRLLIPNPVAIIPIRRPILQFSFNHNFPRDVTARYSIQGTTIRGIAAADEEIELPDSLVGSPVDVEIAYYSERNVQYENNVMSVQVSLGANRLLIPNPVSKPEPRCQGLSIECRPVMPDEEHDNRDRFVIRCRHGLMGFEVVANEVTWTWHLSAKDLREEGNGILVDHISFDSFSKYFYVAGRGRRGSVLQLRDKKDGRLAVSLDWQNRSTAGIASKSVMYHERRRIWDEEPEVFFVLPCEPS